MLDKIREELSSGNSNRNLLMVFKPFMLPFFEVVTIAGSSFILWLVGTVNFELNPLHAALNTISIMGILMSGWFEIKTSNNPIFDKTLSTVNFLIGISFVLMLSALYFATQFELGVNLAELAQAGQLIYVLSPAFATLLILGGNALNTAMKGKDISGPMEAMGVILYPASKILGVIVSALHTLEFGIALMGAKFALVAVINSACIEFLMIYSASRVDKSKKKNDLFDTVAWGFIFFAAIGYLVLVNIAYFQDAGITNLLSARMMNDVKAIYAASGVVALGAGIAVQVLTSLIDIPFKAPRAIQEAINSYSVRNPNQPALEAPISNEMLPPPSANTTEFADDKKEEAELEPPSFMQRSTAKVDPFTTSNFTLTPEEKAELDKLSAKM